MEKMAHYITLINVLEIYIFKVLFFNFKVLNWLSYQVHQCKSVVGKASIYDVGQIFQDLTQTSLREATIQELWAQNIYNRSGVSDDLRIQTI